MSARTRLADSSMKLMNVAHRALLKVSRGRLGWAVGSMPVIELHTVGRSSGQRRSTMLTAPVHDGNTLVLVASKGGDDRHPFWYLNLVAQPDIEVTRNGVTRPMRARTVTAAEKATLWPRIVAAYGGYAAYQNKTDRDIPVVLCEPR